MTHKTYFWSYGDVADFLRENDFEFMEGFGNSEGTWIKLETNGEPEVMLQFTFKPTQYSTKEINRVMRLSKIPPDKWMEWAEARRNEAAP